MLLRRQADHEQAEHEGKVEQNNTTAARRMTGLARIFTRASRTSAGTDCRRKGEQRHAAEKDSKRHLIDAQRPFARTAIARRRAACAFASLRMKRCVRFSQTTSTVAKPKSDPASEAVKIVKTVSFMPRNAPTMAISLTSPKPMPSVPRQRK